MWVEGVQGLWVWRVWGGLVLVFVLSYVEDFSRCSVGGGAQGKGHIVL